MEPNTKGLFPDSFKLSYAIAPSAILIGIGIPAVSYTLNGLARYF
jgi:hypothetical protein